MFKNLKMYIRIIAYIHNVYIYCTYIGTYIGTFMSQLAYSQQCICITSLRIYIYISTYAYTNIICMDTNIVFKS